MADEKKKPEIDLPPRSGLAPAALMEHYHQTGEFAAEATAFLRGLGGAPFVVNVEHHKGGDQRTVSHAYRFRNGRVVVEEIDLEARRAALRPVKPDADEPGPEPTDD